jgi:hypothetical protein
VDEGKIKPPIPWVCDACFAGVVEIICGTFGERKSMKANQLATLVLRLFGIYCLIQIIPMVVTLSSMVIVQRTVEHSDNPILMTFVQASIPSICWLLIAISLLVFSVPLGEKIATGIDGEKVTQVSFEQVQVLAFAVVGAWLAVEGLSQFCGDIYSALTSMQHFNTNQYPGGPQYIDWHLILRAFGALVQIAIGLWMFFGANGFANFWRSARNFGTPKPPEN